MLMLISPAKALDIDSPAPVATATQGMFLSEAQWLIDRLRPLTAEKLSQLMHLSAKLAQLNVQRYQDFTLPMDAHNAKQAVFAFNGDVYEGLSAATLPESSLMWLQSHVRILSGLYGVLRPLDYMQPYRLEMGTPLVTEKGKNLYAFWQEMLTAHIDQLLRTQVQPVLVNLASNEYFSVIDTTKIQAPIITPVFQDEKQGQYKVISFYAKKARGLMVRYAAEHALTEVEQLKGFKTAGYAYCPEASDAQRWVFRRRASAATE